MADGLPFFGPLVLTRSGRPALQENEIEYIMQPEVELESGCEAGRGFQPDIPSLTFHFRAMIAHPNEYHRYPTAQVS